MAKMMDRPPSLPRRRFLGGLLAGLPAVAAAGLPSDAFAQAAGPAAPAPAAPAPAAKPGALVEQPLEFAVSSQQRCSAVVVQPSAAAKLPGLLLVPDTSGLSAHFLGLARRLAGLGYVVMVPTFASAFGSSEDRAARAKLAALNAQQATGFLRAATDQLVAQPSCSGAIGVVAFVWGGPGLSAIAADPGPVKALVLCYVSPLPVDQVAAVKVPIQLHYAGLDERTGLQMDAVERKLMGHSKVYEQYVYEGLNVSFMNELYEKRYDAGAARLAFERIELFLSRHVRGR